MTKKARKAAREEAKAKALGMTVAEMKAANNKKAAEKAGCDPGRLLVRHSRTARLCDNTNRLARAGIMV